MRFASLLVGLAAAVLAACQAPTTPLDPHDLRLAAQRVASYAGEAEWLARQLREGSVTANLAWVHERALGEDAATLGREVATQPVPASLRPAHEKLALLEARLQVAVTRVAAAANRPAELEALQREFHAIAGEARALGQG
jgi:hypothetical protein